ncbi:MAG: HypC/HybG/HupF family hydrogenase formation chaperone [Candidatus Micrarchaeota archaeon]|nr:HypC/HybG/HupF family hydrogenase formation chaperone [Candidatus Micrarchaeota archaeon]
MCIKIPGRVVEAKGNKAVVQFGKQKVSAGVFDVRPKKGDSVLVEAGIVTKIIPRLKRR